MFLLIMNYEWNVVSETGPYHAIFISMIISVANSHKEAKIIMIMIPCNLVAWIIVH